nr:immunoglobulin heavy chain junction region [Macaca mulatta]
CAKGRYSNYLTWGNRFDVW